ncbi:MAG TPA: FUSC family protein [Solirubrobacteraceae bacterium]|nr:FUSC family protein [Solirubrobacteraceae bacterium]
MHAPTRLPRAGELLGQAARRSRDSLRDRVRALPRSLLSIAQAAVAAGVAWAVARALLGHTAPFFAPIAAILTLGLTYGQRGRRAVEIPVGVALGIAVADALVLLLGTGGWQITVVVALAMTAAVLAGGGSLLVSQAAVSAVLVATLQPPTQGFTGGRFLDALVGGAVALLVNALSPTDPMRLVRREAEPLVAALAAVLREVAAALDTRDRARAERALQSARGLDPGTARLREALDVGAETTRIAPTRRRARRPLSIYATAVEEVDHAVRNTRVLSRAAIRAIELGEAVPALAVEAIDALGGAVEALGAFLADASTRDRARDATVRAAALATAALEETGNLSVSVIVGQVRSTSVDLLRAMGIGADDARAAVRAARAQLRI